MFFKWLWQNIGTISVLLVLIAVIVLIIVCRIRAKKRGESSCGCKCSDCAGCTACHTSKENVSHK